MLLDVAMALSPLLLIIFAIALCDAAPDVAAGAAWVYCIGVACLYFHTDLAVALLTSLSGFVAALPVSLVISIAILQVIILIETGALARISVLAKTLSVHDRATQVLLLNCGFAIILTALGAVPISVLPPVLMALGYSVVQSIGLSAMGYSGACTVGLLGIPGQIFAVFCGISFVDAWYIFAWYMPLTNFAVAMGCLWFAGGLPMLRNGFVPAFLVGLGCWVGTVASAAAGVTPIGGVLAGLSIIALLCVFLLLRGSPIMDRSLLTEEDLKAEKRLPLWAAVSPWIMLTVVCALINAPALPLHRILFEDNPMPVHIIPGHPEFLRLFAQPYLWLFVSTVSCVPLLRPRPGLLRDSLRKWLPRMIRPFLAAGIYFSIAYVFNHSGKNADWELTRVDDNMIAVLASAAARTFGVAYAAAAPFLGAAAGIVSGSQSAATAMLTSLHLKTAALLGENGVIIAAAGAMGGGLASMLSPAKLMCAAAAIDGFGSENTVFKAFLLLSAFVTLTLSLVCMVRILL